MLYCAEPNADYEAASLNELAAKIVASAIDDYADEVTDTLSDNEFYNPSAPEMTRLYAIDDDGEQHDLPAAELAPFNRKLESLFDSEKDSFDPSFSPQREWGTL